MTKQTKTTSLAKTNGLGSLSNGLGWKGAVAMAALIIGVASLIGYGATSSANHHESAEGHDMSIYAHAVASEHRTYQEEERDGGRKPAEILAFYGVEPGMAVLDLASGSGYYTVMLSDIVGADGKVYAQQSPRATNERIAGLNERYEPLGNVELVQVEMDATGLPDNSVDRVFLFLLHHHMHYTPDSGEATPDDSKAVYAEIRRILKPGGIFGLIEHEAAMGMSREDANTYHRSAASHAIEDLTAAGFELAGTSDALANADDPMNCMWRKCLEGRDVSQRYVHAYRSPD